MTDETTPVRYVSEEDFQKMEEFQSSKLPRKFNRQSILDAFGEAFELVGGVPRLALWADANPGKFYPVMARLGASNTVNVQNNTALVIRPALPPSPLDDE